MFEQSCGIAGVGCHGTGLIPSQAGRPFLGDFGGGTKSSAVLPGIVGVSSFEDPHLNIVKASDSANSYLVYKVKGTQGTLVSQCMDGKNAVGTGGPCGVSMPNAMAALDDASIALISNWIDQGAQDN
jgi:hypothetical protein